MYNAKEMREITDEAKFKQKILKKCVAQKFFAEIFPDIEEAATNGKSSLKIFIPRKCGFAIKEIFKVFNNFGYGWKVEQQNCFIMVVEICW